MPAMQRSPRNKRRGLQCRHDWQPHPSGTGKQRCAKCRAERVLNKRRGLQSARCHGCEAVVYLTWAQAERHGMPLCAGCGAAFEPDDWELADALGVRDAASLHEYETQLERILRGREGKAHRWGEDLRRATAKTRDGRMTEPELAAHRVEHARRERARAARLNALQPSIVQTEPIPF